VGLGWGGRAVFRRGCGATGRPIVTRPRKVNSYHLTCYHPHSSITNSYHLEAGKEIGCVATVVADSGVENVNEQVDELGAARFSVRRLCWAA